MANNKSHTLIGWLASDDLHGHFIGSKFDASDPATIHSIKMHKLKFYASVPENSFLLTLIDSFVCPVLT